MGVIKPPQSETGGANFTVGKAETRRSTCRERGCCKLGKVAVVGELRADARELGNNTRRDKRNKQLLSPAVILLISVLCRLPGFIQQVGMHFPGFFMHTGAQVSRSADPFRKLHLSSPPILPFFEALKIGPFELKYL
jgi:hypothetical protein